MKINVFCKNHRWLFEDLKQEIASYGAIASDEPLPDADAWICLRDTEAKLSPDKTKTLVTVHHIEPITHDGYGKINFVHPFQKRQYNGNGPSFVLPIGSRNIPPSPFPDKPVLGGFFREVNGNGKRNLKGSVLFKQAVELARQQIDFEVLLIGANLRHIAHIGTYECRGALPDDYARITALMTTSTSQMVPLSVYEAMAAGRPIVTTPREFPFKANNVFMADTVEGLAEGIIKALTEPKMIVQNPFSRSDWCRRMVEEAGKLCNQI